MPGTTARPETQGGRRERVAYWHRGMDVGSTAAVVLVGQTDRKAKPSNTPLKNRAPGI